MVFDDKISSTVSLSRILDYFLSSGEDKETVLSFLEMHSDVAHSYSRHTGNIYGDFDSMFFKLDFEEANHLSALTTTELNLGAFFSNIKTKFQ